MQKVIKSWLVFGLAAGLLASCNQDTQDMHDSATGGETAMLSLSAEVSVDDEQSRAINYKLGNNTQNQLVPLPQFVDKQMVAVHTILKSSRGASVVKTLQWRYDAKKKKLILAPTNKDSSKDANNILITDFNNDEDTKWYISGLLGGTLKKGTTQVSFAGTRSLSGVAGSVGDAVGQLEVPYAFGWVELIIDKNKTRESANNSYPSAKIPSDANIKFSPLGSLIAYTLGNNHGYNFTPNGFVVSSNSWGDTGVFELNTNIPDTNPRSVLPTWTEASATSSIYYTFASGHAPGAIANKAKTNKVYYAWAMPHTTQPTKVSTSVHLKGTSDRPTTSTYRDYTNTWPTDYAPKSTGTAGKVLTGTVHKLTANMTGRQLELPFDYITPYNLAGGTSVKTDVSPQPPGVQGSFRFAMSHDNDASGYYVGYTLKGDTDATFNPNGVDIRMKDLIDLDGKTVRLMDKYHVPTREEWSALVPQTTPALTFGASKQLDLRDILSYGYNKGGTYTSDFSETFTRSNDLVNYAIRFKGSDMKCAYRFTRVGSQYDWNSGSWAHPTEATKTRLVIDVVYLGLEATPTTLAEISQDSWWTSRSSRIITNTIPMAGHVYTNSVFTTNDYAGYGRITDRNARGKYHVENPYWSYSNQRMNYSQASRSGFSDESITYHQALTIRLFKNWWTL